MRCGTSVSQAIGSTPLSLQLWIKVLAIAQRRAPASDPANNEFFLVMVITRSFCPCRARAGSPLSMAPVFSAQGSCSAGGAESDRPVCAGEGTDRHRHLHCRLDVRSCRVCQVGTGHA